jgi:hypothetical protein
MSEKEDQQRSEIIERDHPEGQPGKYGDAPAEYPGTQIGKTE